jgi:hypothetical protein
VLNTYEDIAIILACIAGSLIFLWLLPRVWPASKRRDHNDIIGWQVSVLGTTYAVVIGFMLYAVWTTFQAAELNADSESNCLVNVYRLADGLPAEPRAEVHQLARAYINAVINEEWPAMLKGELAASGHPTIQNMWTVVIQAKPATFAEQTSMSLTLAEISRLTEHRRIRQLGNQSKLPTILWLLMISGGGITILSSCLFGTDNFLLHALQVVSLTLMLSLALVAIADIDRPFQGTLHVTPAGFERAQATFDQLPPDIK